MTSMNQLGLEPVQRSLTQQEQELISWLIEHGTYQNKLDLRMQIPRLSVRERCTCGCPTVYFALDGDAVPRKAERIASDHLATVDSMEVGVMLFVTDGKLSSLELYSCSGTDQPFGLPDISTIQRMPPCT